MAATKIAFPLAHGGVLEIDRCGGALSSVPALGALLQTRGHDAGLGWLAFQTDAPGLDSLQRLSYSVGENLTAYSAAVAHLLAVVDRRELPDGVLNDVAWLLNGLATLTAEAYLIHADARAQLAVLRAATSENGQQGGAQS
ncbi:hypothetical protein [Methylococcus sp. EFPC2]|uniref:hypothetical protein n=1 Tax=Methylococcus sp. EFPC2 TaxID=2812648 RepID=UPI0019680300|nr:hypothetical protein [Methylococcus sp. EFPC2]QSA97126.1 hypothetical protein JWZ97_18360 [Methylococcus sp. EFPC2]